jgi:hypothetical protein
MPTKKTAVVKAKKAGSNKAQPKPKATKVKSNQDMYIAQINPTCPLHGGGTLHDGAAVFHRHGGRLAIPRLSNGQFATLKTGGAQKRAGRHAGVLGIKQCVSSTVTAWNFKRRLNSWLDDYATDACVQENANLGAVYNNIRPVFTAAIRTLDTVKVDTPDVMPAVQNAPAIPSTGGLQKQQYFMNISEDLKAKDEYNLMKDLHKIHEKSKNKKGGLFGVRYCVSNALTRFQMKRKLQMIYDDYIRDACIVKYPQLENIFLSIAPKIQAQIKELAAIKFTST